MLFSVLLFALPYVRCQLLSNLLNLNKDQCSTPRAPPFGTVVVPPKPIVGSTAIFGCEAGYRLVGKTVLTCKKGFFWSGFMPRCEENFCYRPRQPSNGKAIVSADRTFVGGLATFACDVGFLLEGPSVVICKDGPFWSQQSPHCKRNSCWKPPNPENGLSVSTNPVPVGGMASFVCDPGYTLKGSAVMTCIKAGHWNEYLPECVEIVTGASKPQAKESKGGLLTVHEIPSPILQPAPEAIVSVAEGGPSNFRPDDTENPFPQTFSGEASSNSSPLDTTTSHDVVFEETEVEDLFPDVTGSEVGYKALDPRVAGTSIAVLSSIGNQVQCLKLDKPSNGAVTFSSLYPGGVAVYTCDDGYKQKGDRQRQCQADGIWSGSASSCNPK